MNVFEKRRIVKIREDAVEEIDDLLAVEARVRISVNGQYVMSMYCTPLMIRELIVGIVQNEGLIDGEWCMDRMSIEYGDEVLVDIPAAGGVRKAERALTSGCAGGISLVRKLPEERVTDSSEIAVEAVREIYADFQKQSEGYRLTGGLHSAALSDGERILVFSEDIGRHNAVDKVIGFGLLEGISFEGKIMLASGRLSSEIVAKCARSGIPFVVSRAAPTTLAVRIAETAGLTLVGFVRGGKMNIYAGRERLRL